MKTSELKAALLGILIYQNYVQNNAEAPGNGTGLEMNIDIDMQYLIKTMEYCEEIEAVDMLRIVPMETGV